MAEENLLEYNDEKLAFLAQKGNTQAFESLVSRYEARLLRYAKKFLFGLADAQDQVQEVFLKTYVNLKSYNPEKPFSPWIYRIAHNQFINAIKKKVREPLPFFDPEVLFPHPLSKDLPERDMEKKMAGDSVVKYLERLDLKYREPLILYFLEEMNYREISDILEIPVATVGVRLNRAKESLRKLIAEENDGK